MGTGALGCPHRKIKPLVDVRTILIQGRTYLMAPESWLIVTVAAAFMLLGIAASPLAWVALMHRRSRMERQTDRRFLELTGQLRALQDRLQRCESSYQALQRGTAHLAGPGAPRLRSVRTTATVARSGPERAEVASGVGQDEHRLIAIPNLASTGSDREATLSSLTQRYAAIWTLADTGASPDVIARATGQPVGQIELILGLRRQIDGARPNPTISHARHE